MSAESIVSSALADVPKCVAAGVVDMETGMLLGVKTTDSHPQSVLDMVAAGTHELFEGDTTMNIEKAFRKVRGDEDGDHYFQEIFVNSRNLIHVFSRMACSQTIILVTVCRADANLGQVIVKTRNIARSETI